MQLKSYKFGGWCLILFTLLFLGTKLVLDNRFGHLPLTELVAGGVVLRLLMLFYALLPLVLVPAIFTIHAAFKEYNPLGMKVGTAFALSAVALTTLCLMRWPSIYWVFSQIFQQANPTQKGLIQLLQFGIDNYLSIFLSGILTKFLVTVWFWQISVAMFRDSQFPRWLAWIGAMTALVMLLTLTPFFATLSPTLIYIQNIIGNMEFVWLVLLGASLIWLKHPKY